MIEFLILMTLGAAALELSIVTNPIEFTLFNKLIRIDLMAPFLYYPWLGVVASVALSFVLGVLFGAAGLIVMGSSMLSTIVTFFFYYFQSLRLRLHIAGRLKEAGIITSRKQFRVHWHHVKWYSTAWRSFLDYDPAEFGEKSASYPVAS